MPSLEDKTDQRPNILWICTDQQRYNTVHALGNPHIRTPNLDKLVEYGVAFTHTFCQSPICTPSRASFMTGMYPSTVHGCRNNNGSWGDGAPLITKTLANAGYDCGLAGKLHLSEINEIAEVRPDDGYRIFHWSQHPLDNWPEGSGHAYADWLRSKGESFSGLIKRNGYAPFPLHQSTWGADRAIDFMNEERQGPWLFNVHTFDPHSISGKYYPNPEYLENYDIKSLPGPLLSPTDRETQRELESVRFGTTYTDYDEDDRKLYQAQYWSIIELIDENVGRLLKNLEETGQRENTIVIFFSDHGEALGDHGLRKKGCRFYEGLVRVPLIISWPGRFQEGLRSDALVELTDIAPTLLEVAGLEIPARMQGRSLLPILKGEEDPHFHRESVRCEFFGALGSEYATMIRTRDHKLVNYHGHGVGELYDLGNDPSEFNNLWNDPEHAELRFELMTRNFDALAFAVDTGPEPLQLESPSSYYIEIAIDWKKAFHNERAAENLMGRAERVAKSPSDWGECADAWARIGDDSAASRCREKAEE